MEDVLKALRELAESNGKLIEKLDEVKQEIIKDREEKKKKAETRARSFFEMDIEYIMDFKHCNRAKAIEKLQKHKYNVARVVKGQLGMVLDDKWLEHVLCHYEHKRNRQVIERW